MPLLGCEVSDPRIGSMNRRHLKLLALFLCCMSIAAMTPRDLRAENPEVPGQAVDRSVLAALSRHGVTNARVVSHIDLSEPFKTKNQWTFVAVQDESHPVDDFNDHGPLYLCLVKSVSAECEQHLYPPVGAAMRSFATPYQLFAGNVVYRDSNRSKPLFFLKVCGAAGANGNCSIATALYTYDRRADRFVRVFLNSTGRNNNQLTRFVESGPLQGDLIVNYPTEDAPYAYWIEVYRLGESGQYGQILRYRSLTHYSDGNPLAVADSEMPEILRRLRLCRMGDPLPAPPHMPQGCTFLYMRQGEEWCK